MWRNDESKRTHMWINVNPTIISERQMWYESTLRGTNNYRAHREYSNCSNCDLLLYWHSIVEWSIEFRSIYDWTCVLHLNQVVYNPWIKANQRDITSKSFAETIYVCIYKLDERIMRSITKVQSKREIKWTPVGPHIEEYWYFIINIIYMQGYGQICNCKKICPTFLVGKKE